MKQNSYWRNTDISLKKVSATRLQGLSKAKRFSDRK